MKKYIDMDTKKLNLNINDVVKITIQAIFITIAIYAVYARISSDIRSITEKLDVLVAVQQSNTQDVKANEARIRQIEVDVAIIKDKIGR